MMLSWKLFLLIAVLCVAATWTHGEAQTVIAVDLNKAKLSWDWTQGAGGMVEEFRVKCGNTSGNYTRVTSLANPAAREVAVRDAIAGSGNWFCVVTAANQFGESGVSNEVPFVAGAAPSSPTNTRVTAQ